MCAPIPFMLPPGYRRTYKTEIRHKRIYEYAINRWADSNSVTAAKFWRWVSNRCVTEIIGQEPIPNFWKYP